MLGAELQLAQYAALHGAGIATYDNPPVDAAYPYATIGDGQVLDDSTSCGAAWEAFSDVHVWSQPDSGSKIEVKTLMAQIVPLLASESLAVSGFIVVVAQLQHSRVFRDPDGLTEHGVLTFRYLLDPA